MKRIEVRHVIRTGAVLMTMLAWCAAEAQAPAAEEAAEEIGDTMEQLEEAATEEVSAEPVAATEAHQYVGSVRKVCGTVVGSFYNEKSQLKVTLLNLDKDHPDQPFTIVIPSEHRDKWQEAPDKFYIGKAVCVTGKITEHKGKPQIEVDDPGDIEVKAGGSTSSDS